MPPEKFVVASWLQFYEIIMKRAMALGHLYLSAKDKTDIYLTFIAVTCRPDLAIIP